MFGSLSLRRLAALIALLLVALHVTAYPVAGWLIDIEDGPDGVTRTTAILAGGAALVFPWIVGQSIADFTRTLFGRSDLELILASPVDAHSLLAARALSISVGAVASVGLLLAPLADVAALQGPSPLAGALSGPDRGGARGDRLCDHSVDGPVLGDRPATRAPLRPDCGDSDRRVRRARGAGCRRAARGHASDDPRGPRAACKRRGRGARPPVGAGARGGGRPAGDARLDSVWRTRLCARMPAVRGALREGGDRHCGRAGLCWSAGEGGGALWRERQHGLAHQGAARGLARPLADVATSPAGRLYDAACGHSLARRRPDGHGRRRLHAGARGDRSATRRRALLDRALGRGRAGFPRPPRP